MTTKPVFILFMAIALPDILYGITTIHHDKPTESRISEMVTKMTEAAPSTGFPAERQKRLLPYINYYVGRNQRKPLQPKFTPFLESNALPGPFIPIVKTTPKSVEIEYLPEPVPDRSPNYAIIYDTLVQLKHAQQSTRHNLNPIYRKAPVNYVPIQYYEEPYREVLPSKTTIETYSPTDIDIDTDERKKYQEPIPDVEYKLYRYKPQIADSYVTDTPIQNYRTQTGKPYFGEKLIVAKPTITYETKTNEFTQHEKPVTYVVEQTRKPQVNAIVDDKYEAEKITPIENSQQEEYSPVHFITEKPTYVQQYYSSPAANVPTEDTNILAKILKQLQKSNTLPQTLTPQNIDNSIRTLVKILNVLRKQQGVKAKPIVVLEENENTEVVTNSEEENNSVNDRES